MFDYYSTIRNNEFLLALDLPLYGEEILKLNLKEEKITGDFLKRIPKKESVKKFFRIWKSWINARVEEKIPTAKVQHYEDRLELVAALSKEESVTLTLHGLNKQKFYSRQTLSYSNNLTNESLKLELFTSECRNPAMH